MEHILNTLIVFPPVIKERVMSITGMYSIYKLSDTMYDVKFYPEWYNSSSSKFENEGFKDTYLEAIDHVKSMAKNILHGIHLEINSNWEAVNLHTDEQNTVKWVTPLHTYTIYKFQVNDNFKYLLNTGNAHITTNSVEEAKNIAECDAYMRMCTMLSYGVYV